MIIYTNMHTDNQSEMIMYQSIPRAPLNLRPPGGIVQFWPSLSRNVALCDRERARTGLGGGGIAYFDERLAPYSSEFDMKWAAL